MNNLEKAVLEEIKDNIEGMTEEEAINGYPSRIARELAVANNWNNWIVQFEEEVV